MKQFSALVLFLILMAGCAGRVPPSGGPIDTTPPQIIATNPLPGAVHVRTHEISIEFSKYVDRRSFQESFFLSPRVGTLSFDWSGTEVVISWKKDLIDSTTYVATVGTDVVDLRNKNKLAKAFSFAFTTGEQIDSGAIAGRIVNDQPGGVMVFAYRVNPARIDSLNPVTTEPDFVTQSSANGTYQLSHLPMATYCVIAVRDVYKNFLYDPGTDDIGIPSALTILSGTSPGVEHVNFQIHKEDTLAPRLTNIIVHNRENFTAQISKDIDTSRISAFRPNLADTLGHQIPLSGFGFALPMISQVRLNSAPLDTAQEYILTLDSLFDAAGLIIDPRTRSYRFRASAAPDTMPIFVVYSSISDSTENQSPESMLNLEFSSPVDQKRVIDSLSFTDSLHAPVIFEPTWLTSMDLRLVPAMPLKVKMRYRVHIPANGLMKPDARIPGRTFSLTFTTMAASQLSSLEGTIRSASGKDSGMGYVVQARRIDPQPVKVFETKRSGTGAFSFPYLPEGRYLVSGYQTVGNSYRYQAGTIHPFQPSAPFISIPDTLRLRARWPMTGMNLVFP